MRTQEQMVRRITRAYRQTTPAQLAAGLGWYAEAWKVAQEILPGNPYLAAGVIAALSPRCQWSTNVAWATALVQAAMEGRECPPVHTTTMRAQAWRIANGTPALDVLNGPKVRSFYSNITGDTDAVTCDVWATYVAAGHKDAITPAQYRCIADAYRRAAKILGVTPREVQAATWIAARGVKPTDVGFHARAAA
jgi:hypothetical protein